MLQYTQNYTALAINLFIQELHHRGAIKIDTIGGFKLKLHDTNPDAPLSPLYINLRLADNKQGPLTYQEVQKMANFMVVFITLNKLQFDGICGIPRAGDPFAEEIQKLLFHGPAKRDVPRLVLDKYEGDKIRRIGNVTNTDILPPGSRVLLIDDLITKADSKFEAIDRLRGSGYRVENSVVFLDRQQGGKRAMQEKGVDLNSVISLSSVLLILVDAKLITNEQHDRISLYLKQNS